MATKPSKSVPAKELRVSLQGYGQTWRFYAFAYRTMTYVVWGLSIVILFFAVVLCGRAIIGSPEPVYYAQNTLGQLKPLVPMSTSVPTNDIAYQYLYESLSESFSLSSDTYKKSLELVKAYYIDNGYNMYINTLVQNKLAGELKHGSTTIVSELSVPPTLDTSETHMYDKTFVWSYHVTLLHTIRNERGVTTVEHKYKVMLKHLPFNVRGRGLAVYSIKLES